MTFEELSTKRRNYIEAARDNGFEEGLRKLLSDLYPDNAHFIYELMQNAEDAGAREVRFDLRTDGLQVKHDGPLLFDLDDIDSITGIGQSTKADDATSIGKFGIGFKAVFAYTQTPVISSGEYSFAIHDLFIPVPVPGHADAGWTTFWFPFDRADKQAGRAVKEVASALREISGTTLLFLKNIHSIACFLPDGDERLLERRALDDNVVEIDSIHEEVGPSYWYRVIGDVAAGGNSYPVAAAFALEPHASIQSEAKKPKEPKNYTVKPVHGQVFIYFPAVRETSGLKFHIHAPFGSTVARDSVRDDPGNDALVKGIAKLVADALPRMRKAGLITDGLLSALPNNNDDLPPRYSVLRDQITSAFGIKSLTPMVGRGHAPARSLLRSNRNIRSTLSVDDANFLRGLYMSISGKLATGWLADREGRAGAFLNSLEVLDFARDELSEALERVATLYDEAAMYEDDIDEVDRAGLESWHLWIAAKDDASLRDFYAMLEALAPKARTSNYFTNRAGDEFLSTLTTAPLVRVQDGEGARHVPGPEAHLPTSTGLRVDGLVLDTLALFDGADDSERLELVHAFFRHAGVKPWDAAAQLDARFSTYSGERAAITEQHLDDLKTLARLIEDKAVSPSTYSARPILVAARRDGTPYWARPSGVYLDEPFAPTGLASLYESDEYSGTPPGRLYEKYLDAAPEVAELANSLGVIRGLSIVPVHAKNNPEFKWAWVDRENHNKVSSDWCIHHFDVIVSCGNETLLRGLWTLVTSAQSMHADAVYRSNGSSGRHDMQSQLLQKLTSEPWILDRDGNLSRPQDITSAELAECLTVPTHSPLLDRAGFGRNAAVEAMRQRGDEARAKALGFESVDVLHEIAEVYKEDPEGFREWLQNRKSTSLPTAASSAPEQRAKRSAEHAANAPFRSYDKRVRSVYVQVPGHLSSARNYLRQLYTNDDHLMVCQVCSSSMPFKIAGNYYFEAVQFVRNARHDLAENRLALCPTCAAKYRHARGTSLEDLRDDLLAQGVGHQGSITVDVVLADEATQVRFVGKHAIDLQAALSATEGQPIEDDEFDKLEE